MTAFLVPSQSLPAWPALCRYTADSLASDLGERNLRNTATNTCTQMYTEATLASNLGERNLRNTATNTCTQMLINVFKPQVSIVSLRGNWLLHQEYSFSYLQGLGFSLHCHTVFYCCVYGGPNLSHRSFQRSENPQCQCQCPLEYHSLTPFSFFQDTVFTVCIFLKAFATECIEVFVLKCLYWQN